MTPEERAENVLRERLGYCPTEPEDLYTTIEPIRVNLLRGMAAEIRAAIADEREACAEMANNRGYHTFADEIRARV